MLRAAIRRCGSIADHYQVLGLQRCASQEQIREAYLRHAKAHHPDMKMHMAQKELAASTERFKMIQSAWDTLGHPKKRAAYDRANTVAETKARDTAGAAGPWSQAGSRAGKAWSQAGTRAEEAWSKAGEHAQEAWSQARARAEANGQNRHEHWHEEVRRHQKMEWERQRNARQRMKEHMWGEGVDSRESHRQWHQATDPFRRPSPAQVRKFEETYERIQTSPEFGKARTHMYFLYAIGFMLTMLGVAHSILSRLQPWRSVKPRGKGAVLNLKV
eukprot:gnl/TRDRNA2_/TRDRNA2_168699_c0_seq1.p1 gnl/TRDRNA2_/TRDRNA2_168699_c0~~gnl/TRDRNA2_/TRDRNA2_168699_c0_seq1.p1  ORF type:complete len:273 (-),score=49.94 gnl/TRDRNA2_/TRDRNA2_168699_c0_seq1:137-955(-)